jgi:hypothetical protein
MIKNAYFSINIFSVDALILILGHCAECFTDIKCQSRLYVGMIPYIPPVSVAISLTVGLSVCIQSLGEMYGEGDNDKNRH